MFNIQIIKVITIAAIVVLVLTTLNVIVSALLSIIIYVVATIIVIGILSVIFISNQKWINGANKAQAFSEKIEQKIYQFTNKVSRVNVVKHIQNTNKI